MAAEHTGAGEQEQRQEKDGVVFVPRYTASARKIPKTPAAAGQDHGAKLLAASFLWGSNAHHSDTVIVQDVDLGALAAQGSASIGAEFVSHYIARFNAIDTAHPELGSAQPECALEPGFVERLRSKEGVTFSELLFRAIQTIEAASLRAMRRLHGVSYGEIVGGPEPEQATFVWSCCEPEVSRRAAQVGLLGVTELLPDELTWPSAAAQEGFDPALARALKAARRHRPLPPAAILLDAARRRGIPWEKIGGNVIRLGQGRFQHRIWSTVTSRTSRVADRLSQDKVATHRVLDDIGLPVPRQIFVANAREARAAAEEIGYPVVVKPLGGNTGKGVSANLKGRKEIAPAFRRAREVGREVVVESFIEGRDHRLLVVGGQVIAAAIRVPPSVTGDGKRTIGELIDDLNADPLRDNFRRARIKLDHELDRLLDLAGRKLASVLPDGESFQLRSTANVSTGGFTKDVTDALHPDNREMAIRAAEAVGLDVAGVDFLTTDITRSYREVGGGIVEVNSRPGLRPHIWPLEGTPRDVGSAVIETMFPPDSQGRVPVAVVTGAAAQAAGVAARTAALLRFAGKTPAMVSGDEAVGSHAGKDDGGARERIRRRLSDPRLEAMLRVAALGDIAQCGLLIDRCETVAILGALGGAVERRGLEVLRRATRGRVVVAAGAGLPADSLPPPGSAQLLLVAAGKSDDLLKAHLAASGAAVVAESGAEGIAISFVNLPSVAGGGLLTVASLPPEAPLDLVEAELFAAALAFSLGLSPEELRRALSEEPPPSATNAPLSDGKG
ncbi:ATP-grasp domain-containing protein [Pelagibius sp.]|uniref:ATP-grasp domain-containing protein n=1 Tax=Pelagibius sp. TaxID=1931238 RepID=UPI00262EAC17|nr:ATP-grasp domain-containing protein [Pelagibius sp.]